MAEQTDRTGYSTGGSEMERETEGPQRQPEAHQHSSTLKTQIGRFYGGTGEEWKQKINFEMIQHFDCLFLLLAASCCKCRCDLSLVS